VIKRGREVARERGAPPLLEFTSEPGAADGFDVLFAAGVLQYIEAPPLADLIGALRRPPTHLLLNKLPLNDGARFVTLQNARVSVTPQYVFNEREFLDPLIALGYQLVDRWDDYVHSCHIPFHHQREVEHYGGFYLRRPETPSYRTQIENEPSAYPMVGPNCPENRVPIQVPGGLSESSQTFTAVPMFQM
jgi:putative methyltransferase (TIGR04325 family)